MQKLNNKQKYHLAFNYFQKIGPIKMRLIENYFSNLKEAFYASSIELEKIGLNQKIVNEFIKWRTTFNLQNCLQDLESEDIKIICWHDQEYPALLLEIHAPPPLLYYKGDINVLNCSNNRLAVVGSRQHSAYADKIISHLIPPLIENKIVIVSGLAYGVDTLAHRETLINKGQTIAVLGSGLNNKNIYPYVNKKLSEQIFKNNGLLISEFPPQTPPLKQNFPQRNRIISGLCQATLVIESKNKSGSLITAYQALDQNREVLAVPGNIFSEFSDGPNSLIKKGAKPVSVTEDILEIYKLNQSGDKSTKKIQNNQDNKIKEKLLNNNDEKEIYLLIKIASERGEKISSEEIAQNVKLDTSIINSTLSILEIQDLIKNEFGNYSLL